MERIASPATTQLSVEVSQQPRYQIVADATREALAVYDLSTKLMVNAIKERLRQAAREADVEIYRNMTE